MWYIQLLFCLPFSYSELQSALHPNKCDWDKGNRHNLKTNFEDINVERGH